MSIRDGQPNNKTYRGRPTAPDIECGKIPGILNLVFSCRSGGLLEAIERHAHARGADRVSLIQSGRRWD